ncbi:hypothetical protein BGZ60DRAFT_436753 [Tricladium varicosporioides]|nr:hypothetical protein BGZ60DRAFT_436753 [Hymenoscyphus varicosporioides]
MAETTAPRLITALIVMVTTSLAFIVLRLVCKGRYGRKYGWDDYILAFSWVCLLIYSSLTITSCKYGIGGHIYDVSPGKLKIGVKLLYIGEFFAIIAVAISKTSFAVTLLRLATKHWHMYMIWFIIISLNLVMWFCGLFQFIQCSPVEKLWDLTAPGTCWDPHIQINYAIFAGSYSAVMDFLLALFPWLLIWKLQMKTAEKVGVGIAMSLGVLAGITAIVKTSYIIDIGRWTDFTYSSTNLLIWAASETAVTIIAASIPFLRLVVKEVSHKSKNPTSSGFRLESMGTNKSRHRGAATRTNRCVVVAMAAGRCDGGSEKSILGDTGDKNKTILQTNEIAISYQDIDAEMLSFNSRGTLLIAFMETAHSQQVSQYPASSIAEKPPRLKNSDRDLFFLHTVLSVPLSPAPRL